MLLPRPLSLLLLLLLRLLTLMLLLLPSLVPLHVGAGVHQARSMHYRSGQAPL